MIVFYDVGSGQKITHISNKGLCNNKKVKRRIGQCLFWGCIKFCKKTGKGFKLKPCCNGRWVLIPANRPVASSLRRNHFIGIARGIFYHALVEWRMKLMGCLGAAEMVAPQATALQRSTGTNVDERPADDGPKKSTV